LAARKLVADGIDPVEAKKSKKTAAALASAREITFKTCAEAYISAHRDGWRNAKHAAQWETTLATYVYPVFGDLPVAAIDVGLVLRALEPIWRDRTETASRVRGRIESILDYAKARKWREGENPARWKGNLEFVLLKRAKAASVVHHAALPYADLPEFLAELRQRGGLAARALEFLILTASRSGELLGARWEEIDLEGRLWTIPGSRMKAGREHRVPLSDAALAVLTALPNAHEGRIFRVGVVAMSRVLGLMRAGITVHGFRSSFSTWAIEQTNFPSEVREMALAHMVGSAVVRAYRRSDLFEKRRELAEVWARFCLGDTPGP
jgi:integrase